MIGAIAALAVLVAQRRLDAASEAAKRRQETLALTRVAVNNFWWAQRHIERLLNGEALEIADRLVLVELSPDDWKSLAAHLTPDEWRVCALASSRLRVLDARPFHELAGADTRLLFTTYSALERGREALATHTRLPYERRALRLPPGVEIPEGLRRWIEPA
jgi:hypothetical protein